MYDLVSGEFKWNVGSWNFTAWAEAQDDVEVYVEWTKEKIWVVSKEYYTTDWADVWYIIWQNFVITENSNYTVTAPIRFDTWTYDVSWSEETTWARPFTIFPCDSEWNLVWDTPLYYKARSDAWLNTGTFTTNWVLARVSVRNSYTDVTIKREMPTTTATCEDLLWVWDYKDEQEILSGNVITNVGVAVLTGNESWVASSAFAGSCYWLPQWATTIAKSYVGLCSHFASASAPSQYARGKYLQELNAINLWYSDNKTTAVADLKQFLADQYNAWTPVIVVYALATPTTLSVAWQTLSIPAWDSRIEIVEWSILDLPLYAKYKSTTE
jgi:hypothetical protein